MAHFNQLQRARVLSHNLADASWLFGSVLPRLEAVEMNCTGVEYFNYMFYGCRSLQSVPQFDTSSGTDFNSMFEECRSLQYVPQFDTSSGTNFIAMFVECQSLKSVPQFDLSNGTDFNYMFYGCRSLQSVPQFDTSSGTDFNSMFEECRSLQYVPQFDTSSGTNFIAMFYGCQSLQSVPQFDLSNGTNLYSLITNSAVSRVDITAWPTEVYIGLDDAYLSAASLNKIYTDLPETTGGEVAVYNNYGVSDPAHDPTIATTKGWTVYY